MSNVRVTYSGLIAFLVSISGVITGTIFVVIISRRLSPDEFGLWSLIGFMLGYVLILEPITTYWTTRQLAREKEVGKTAVASISMFSSGGIIIYFIIVLFVGKYLEADSDVLLVSGLLVPLMFFINLFNGIALSNKPQSISYGTLAFEVIKIPIGAFFIIFLEFGIMGAILTTIIGQIIRLVILFFFNKERISGKIKLSIIKFWIKMSWLVLYSGSAGLIHKFDVMSVTMITNSLSVLAYWQAGLTTSGIVAISNSISQALYPKLLAENKKEYAQETLKRTLFFAIPIVGMAIVFAKPVMHVLNPIYADASLIVIFLASQSLVGVLTGIYTNILTAFEKVDKDSNSTFKQYVKSRLFFIPTINHLIAITYIVTLLVFLFFFTENSNEIEIVSIWSIILLCTHTPYMIYLMSVVQKTHNISFPLKELIKYGTVTLFAGTISYVIIENYLEYSESVFDFLPQFIPIVILGGIIYFGITYLIDKSVRNLFKSIWREILKK